MAQRKKNRRATRLRAEPSKVPQRKSAWLRVLWLVVLLIVGLSTWRIIYVGREQTTVASKSPLPALAEILSMTPTQLEGVDIALMNLRCAEGLRGSESLDVTVALQRLDEYAKHVERETTRHLYRFRRNPEEFENSEAYFRLMMMAMVLQEDFGVRYNPKWIATPGTEDPNDDFCANSQNVFIHGLTGPPVTGTCASMPVLYVAVGRRLGYPLYLATTKRHLFVRWEDTRTRLNVECTTEKGLGSFEDDYYKTFPFKITDAEVEADGHLKSKTPSEELAEFIAARAECLIKMRRYPDAVKAQRVTVRLAPHIRHFQTNLAYSEKRLQQLVIEARQRQIEQMNWLLDHAGQTNVPPPPGFQPNRPNGIR
jgi:hypothetical protein